MSELDLRGLNYVVGGIHQQVLTYLDKVATTPQHLLEVIDHPLARLLSVSDFVTDCLSVLAVEGHVTLDGHLWSITDSGKGLLNFLKSKSEKPKTFTVATKKEYKPDRSQYQGLELQTTSPRRGAYDFLALPSRYGDSYVPHPTAHLAERHKEQYSGT